MGSSCISNFALTLQRLAMSDNSLLHRPCELSPRDHAVMVAVEHVEQGLACSADDCCRGCACDHSLWSRACDHSLWSRVHGRRRGRVGSRRGCVGHGGCIGHSRLRNHSGGHGHSPGDRLHGGCRIDLRCCHCRHRLRRHIYWRSCGRCCHCWKRLRRHVYRRSCGHHGRLHGWRCRGHHGRWLSTDILRGSRCHRSGKSLCLNDLRRSILNGSRGHLRHRLRWRGLHDCSGDWLPDLHRDHGRLRRWSLNIHWRRNHSGRRRLGDRIGVLRWRHSGDDRWRGFDSHLGLRGWLHVDGWCCEVRALLCRKDWPRVSHGLNCRNRHGRLWCDVYRRRFDRGSRD
mmetsp:Transcript_151400/g.384854  ORF Transcript_151400/g.384854 Transcript_151400/m.384854 type:complete len:343 (+) Transcript_151400:244-1272(+)